MYTFWQDAKIPYARSMHTVFSFFWELAYCIWSEGGTGRKPKVAPQKQIWAKSLSIFTRAEQNNM